MGLEGRHATSNISKLQKNWSKVSHAAREMATVSSISCIVLVAVGGKMVNTPLPQMESASAHRWL